MSVGQRAAVRVPPRPRAAHLEQVQLVTVRELPPVVVEDGPEREVAPEVIYDARKVPREAVRAEQGVVDGPRRRRERLRAARACLLYTSPSPRD